MASGGMCDRKDVGLPTGERDRRNQGDALCESGQTDIAHHRA